MHLRPGCLTSLLVISVATIFKWNYKETPFSFHFGCFLTTTCCLPDDLNRFPGSNAHSWMYMA